LPRARAGIVVIGLGNHDDGALVVSSKLHPPAPRRGTVIRRNLLSRLAESVAAKLVLVVAPAGWGKTSLLGDWYSSSETARIAWLSVDQGDNDPVRFWTHFVAALNLVSPENGTDARQLLTVTRSKTMDVVLPHVINHFALLHARTTLVIDDYHLIVNEAVHERVEFLVEHLPPTLRLVLATRSDPALPLARLRGRGEMTEIRAEDLRFTEAETAGLLNETLKLGLQPQQVSVLQDRTEGWAAGVYLAGLSLRGHEDRDRQVHSFAGDNRQIVDYLVAEVIDRQPDHIRSFLMRTAVLDRLSGPLCDVVTGARGSQHILEEMERSDLFILPLDASRRWYRYHSLFADVLRRELDRCEPGLEPLLHRRASNWHRQHGSTAEAVGHAIMASDLADARELIATRWTSHFNEGLAGSVESWLDSLPTDMVVDDSRLCLARAWLASHRGRLAEVEAWVRAAEAATPHGSFTEGPSPIEPSPIEPSSIEPGSIEPRSIESAACILRADSFHILGDIAGAESASRRAVELERTGTPRWRVAALASLGASLCWLGRDGEAREVLGEVTEPHRPAAGNLPRLWALGCLAAISLRRGELDLCEHYLRQANDLAARHDLGKYREAATAVLTSADLLEGSGELRKAEEAAVSGLDVARRGRARLETVLALLCLARINIREGDSAGACARLAAATEVLGTCPTPGVLAEAVTSTARQAGKHVPHPRVGGETNGRRPDGLTGREAQVFQLLAAGRTNSEIAAELVVSVHTVERHLQNGYRKVGVRNRGEAAAYIIRTAQLTPRCPGGPSQQLHSSEHDCALPKMDDPRDGILWPWQ
jgi:LuxR family transcriptional regulator, maltose regulon positive regulatory protein